MRCGLIAVSELVQSHYMWSYMVFRMFQLRDQAVHNRMYVGEGDELGPKNQPVMC